MPQGCIFLLSDMWFFVFIFSAKNLNKQCIEREYLHKSFAVLSIEKRLFTVCDGFE